MPNNIKTDFMNSLSVKLAGEQIPGSEYSDTMRTYQTEEEKEESKEATGAGSAGGFEGPLFSSKEIKEIGKTDDKDFMEVVKKYIGKIKDKEKLTKIYNSMLKQLEMGINVEMEHTKSKKKAKKIALDHLAEDPAYYTKLKKADLEEKKKVETKEATSTASSGSYVTPAAWAKSTSKKDWRGASKTQIPGGKFVQVKKKCKKFPYCNQGDIKALNIFESELVKNCVKNISKKHNISESIIMDILIKKFNETHNKSNK